MATLFNYNHYGLPTSPEEKQCHLNVVPPIPEYVRPIERIISASSPEILSAVIVHYYSIF